ncbi:c-type cytochrome [Azospira restricta]|uniref:C-type cytochrome n=1 Tax=Azospira restricta TaxID=404405 RepID=A0A974PVM3_9RHOO|nr:cytochrome c [Azospira restricta]QRJ62357.1 c-type cytochrome [Azospira restricta]
MRLSSKGFVFLAAAAAILAGPAAAAEKDKYDIGKREYMNKCAVCHGPSGKGDGGATDLLKRAPSDLTTLSKKNSGVFPFERVYAVIDGREVVKGHGDRDMPIWGREYAREQVAADQYYYDMPYNMEMYVRARILALIDYLHRIQAK